MTRHYIVMSLLFLLLLCVSACTHEPVRPIVGEIRTETIKVPVPVACVNEADLPKRPPTAMPSPDADEARLMAGAVSDARALGSYADQLEAALKACSRKPSAP